MLYSCVAKAPKITSQPVSHNNILPGNSVVFSVQSTGTKPLNYHWQWKQFGKAGEKGGWQNLFSEDSRFQLMEVQAWMHVMQATISVWSPTLLVVKLHSVPASLLVSNNCAYIYLSLSTETLNH